ncbi:MAG: transcription-repair coupling factor [Acidimicrobiales bacterium]
MSLEALPGLLASEPGIAELLGADDSVVAVGESARPAVLAAMAVLGAAPVVLIATPTMREAENLAHDLTAYAGPECVDVLPAWETLPFERVSPGVETMGRRLRAMWHLRTGGPDAESAEGLGAGLHQLRRARPRLVVAPVRALLQRLGPRVEDVDPIRVHAGQELDVSALVRQLVDAGYRREYQVEHRGELAVRGGILDVFPSTADEGVRIDLWGDQVERLTRFEVGDQRSTGDIEYAEFFGCRELVLTDAVRARARALAKDARFARDVFDRIADGLMFDGMESWLPWLTDDDRLFTDLLAPDARVVLVEPRRLRDRAAELLDEEESLADALASTWMPPGEREAPSGQGRADRAGAFSRLHLPFERLLARSAARVTSIVTVAGAPGVTSIPASGWPPVLGDAGALARRLTDLSGDGYRVVIAADGAGSARRIKTVLDEQGLNVDLVNAGPETSTGPSGSEAGRAGQAGSPPLSSESPRGGDLHLSHETADAIEDSLLRRPGVHITIAQLDKGAVFPNSKLAILAEPDITGRRRPHRVARPRQRATEGFFDDLAPGSFVVHHVHGVARYGGLVKRQTGGTERDYLLLEYRGGDKLYVPSDQIDAITPYSGGDSPSPSRLGGSDWQKQKARVRAATREIARELVQLYQRRATIEGHVFAPDTPWQTEMEQAFPYPETVDQLMAIEDVKADMERPIPMDRLVCGDVGFGKTEVALRAVFKAVQDGFQAAVLVPTTLLASQHVQTFADRYAPYPIRVEMLSRFLTSAEARKVVDGLADGSVDVVIGTHRLLGGDVKFKKLGLLVVDEEHRFGVSHKEAIKMLTTGVDVLTLTASPIPRTLELSLTGIRDLSLINTPPSERQPILTYVGEYDDRAAAEAIRRELLREGQVFFVHNRVQDIEATATRLQALVPDARIAIAHGQMDEGSLEQIVLDFWEGRYDVLVCTTIIESGIDMPTVNTMVVDRADMLGLGQLHQLRGRVGRGDRRAYAYLLFPPDRVLSEQAYERLRTIGEHTELGSGFKIAMRDLEIRGAGNLLGNDQSGHIAAVGYDLYVRMVSEAVAELKGEPLAEPAEITIDLPLRASLPDSYVGREDLRLEAYRRLVESRGDAGLDDLRREWLDRYGPLPGPAEALLTIGRLRVECVRTGVKEISAAPARPGTPGNPGRSGEIVARLSPVVLPVSSQVRLGRVHPRAIWKEESNQLIVPLKTGDDLALRLVELLGELLPAGQVA